MLAVSAGTHQSFLNDFRQENSCTYIMLWSSGMKLVAFPDVRPDVVLLLLAAIGLAALLLICNTHNTHSKPEQLESHFTHKTLPDASSDRTGNMPHVQIRTRSTGINDKRCSEREREREIWLFLACETELFLMTKARLVKLL